VAWKTLRVDFRGAFHAAFCAFGRVSAAAMAFTGILLVCGSGRLTEKTITQEKSIHCSFKTSFQLRMSLQTK
jgi:hypothetical protein